MRKSKHISKYHLDWQITRVKAKKLKTVQEKCAHVRAYFDAMPSEQNWERVVNYLEGLSMGYRKKNAEAVAYIANEIISYGDRKSYTFDADTIFGTYTNKELQACYKDNFKRYSNYASKGYFHKEIYEFVKSFDCADSDAIEAYKQTAEQTPNSHTFFF